ncbi:hypothetical protein [Marinivivus vitaminiproducens]|uniref:hypothetical protein n=1 Tax=Marinivivus vitaminiproducens TaxID=3035935 RepID=UPI00279B0B27|nr:hypothetical protein P4R82_10965 [Geminicoccaceae bacterium SCSIO 64248]
MRTSLVAPPLVALVPFALDLAARPAQALELTLGGYVDVQAIGAGDNRLDDGNDDNDSEGADRSYLETG